MTGWRNPFVWYLFFRILISSMFIQMLSQSGKTLLSNASGFFSDTCKTMHYQFNLFKSFICETAFSVMIVTDDFSNDTHILHPSNFYTEIIYAAVIYFQLFGFRPNHMSTSLMSFFRIFSSSYLNIRSGSGIF